MSWSLEEESFAAEFLRKVQFGKPTVLHDAKQLEHVETQLAKSQAGITGEGEVQTIKFNVINRRLSPPYEFPIKLAVGKQFINGMVSTARYLRRNIK